jgi:ABC-type Zn uptake system ZnuABC Zn-binding protein ZnuA
VFAARLRPGLRSLLALLAAIVVVGCSSASSPAPVSSAAPLKVVATTTVFADMVRNVGGDLVSVASLVPANGDVHTFSPKPSDMARLAGARVVVMNGLGLDDWLDKLIGSVTQGDTTVVKLGENLPSVAYDTGDDPTSTPNPHLWMNVQYGELYVGRIRDALKGADPADAATFDRNASAYLDTLATTDGWVRDQIGSIPAANRRFVSFHDAFPYYAQAYGLTIVGVAVAAPGQDPSAAYAAQLITAIRQTGVKAIFSEAQFPPRLVDQLAASTGATVVSNLYDDAIGNPPITTYDAIIRWDTQQFVSALA